MRNLLDASCDSLPVDRAVTAPDSYLVRQPESASPKHPAVMEATLTVDDGRSSIEVLLVSPVDIAHPLTAVVILGGAAPTAKSLSLAAHRLATRRYLVLAPCSNSTQTSGSKNNRRLLNWARHYARAHPSVSGELEIIHWCNVSEPRAKRLADINRPHIDGHLALSPVETRVRR